MKLDRSYVEEADVLQFYDEKYGRTKLGLTFSRNHLALCIPQLISILDPKRFRYDLEKLFDNLECALGNNSVRVVDGSVKLITNRPDLDVINDYQNTFNGLLERHVEPNIEHSVAPLSDLQQKTRQLLAVVEKSKSEQIAKGHQVDRFRETSIAYIVDLFIDLLEVAKKKDRHVPLIRPLGREDENGMPFFNDHDTKKNDKMLFKARPKRLAANLLFGFDWEALGEPYKILTEARIEDIVYRVKKRGNREDVLEQRLKRQGFEVTHVDLKYTDR